MKLLYITNGIDGSGGLERVLSVKASYLTEYYGYEVHLLELNATAHKPFYDFSSAIQIHAISAGGSALNYIKAYKKGIQELTNQIKPDIISVCDDGLKGFFLPHLIKTEAKWIYERHASIHLNTNSGLKGRFLRHLMNFSAARFDRFVVLTPSNIKEWQGSNVIAIANPLSFISSEVSSLDRREVIAVGSHSHNKGYDLLLEAWKQIEKKYPDWRLTIYGKMDTKKTYPSLAQEYHLQNVRFESPVSNIREKYLESSIMVLSSRSEGFGMVLIEAMECGVPCVSFDCPAGPRDIITTGVDGLLVPGEDSIALAMALETLVTEKELRCRMGAEAKKNVRRFAPENIVGQWHALFQELTKTNKTAN